MKEIFPDYYKKFKCIADKCLHSCCKGWEIDIDEDTLEFYESMDSAMGEKIRQNISYEDMAHFVLCEEERCPFLNAKGLCDIITECGEDALCNICRLHPRFRSFFENFTETGLGLCCEEAVRVVIFHEEKFKVENFCEVEIAENETEFFEIRQGIFDLLQDRSKTIFERFCCLAENFGFEFSFDMKKTLDFYKSLERLDDEWTRVLDDVSDFCFDGKIFEKEEFFIVFEQLSCYFILRHLTEALYCGDYAERVRFALLSCFVIGGLISFYFDKNDFGKEKLVDLVRLYSSEIEYSEENVGALMEFQP